MTSIAQEKSTTAATASVERAVFVTDDERRSRIVRRATLIVLAAAGLWLAALAVGMLGLGRLPGVSLPLPAVGGKANHHVDRPTTAPIVPAAVMRRTATRTDWPSILRSSAATAPTAVARKQAKAKAAARTRNTSTRRRAATPATRTTTAPGQASTPTRVARGLERRGLTVAPGQTRKATAEPKAVPGQVKTPQGQAKKATETAPPAQPPAPPGQQKPDKPPAKA